MNDKQVSIKTHHARRQLNINEHIKEQSLINIFSLIIDKKHYKRKYSESLKLMLFKINLKRKNHN